MFGRLFHLIALPVPLLRQVSKVGKRLETGIKIQKIRSPGLGPPKMVSPGAFWSAFWTPVGSFWCPSALILAPTGPLWSILGSFGEAFATPGGSFGVFLIPRGCQRAKLDPRGHFGRPWGSLWETSGSILVRFRGRFSERV